MILAAGSFMNFVAGFLLVALLFTAAGSYAVPVIREFAEGFSCAGADGLQVGDRILSINGHTISVYQDVSTQLAAASGAARWTSWSARDGEHVDAKRPAR